MTAPQPNILTADQSAPRPRGLLLALCAIFGVLAAATGLLWLSLGSTLFFEILRAGLAACFG